MNRRLWSVVLAVSVSVASAAASIAGCGSDTTADDNAGDGGDETASGSSGASSGFTSSSGSSGTSGTSGASGGPNNCTPPMALALTPADKVVNVVLGMPFSQAYTATATYAGGTTKDVTADTFFTVDDPGAGKFTGNTFAWSGTQGGKITVSGKTCGAVGATTLTLKVSVSFGAGGGVDAGADGSAGGDGGLEGTFNSAPSAGSTACNPSLVYPPDGVLIPPNTNVIEVHFTDGTPANNLFEIAFENAVTDVKVYTTCTGATPASGLPSSALVPPNPGGCVFELSQPEWDFIAKTNRNGDPVTITVRGLGCDGSGGVGTSNTRSVSFAKDDMRGTLYYWASERITISGQNYNSGGVYRYDFGVRGQTATPVLTPSSGANPTHLCIGCHDISRDGRQMVFDFDDNDDDDEYSDVRTDVYDVALATPAQAIVKNGTNVFPPGFHTWNRSTTEFLLSDGFGNSSTPNGAFRRVSPTGTTAGYAATVTPARGTTPDMAPDDSRVVFAVPPNTFVSSEKPGYWLNKAGVDDLMFAGASLYVASWNATTHMFGPPKILLANNGAIDATADNFYYPSFSPEGSLIVYNYAATGPNFHNPKAKIEVISASAATPTRCPLAKLNDTGDVTNSWARWAPFVQTYKGKQLLWVTTSSTRNYGLRIDNGGTTNCYPNESPNFVTPVFTNNMAKCSRTQLWMAAVELDAAKVQAGTDVSYPAFYLPFQDITTNNHLAQWAQKSFQGGCKVDSDCSAQPGKCCDMGGCTSCPTPPAPSCAMDSNCAMGQCCNTGVCGACSAGDGGAEGGGPTGCTTCLDCGGQACNMGTCGSCTNSSQCCAPLVCNAAGACVAPVN